MPSRLRAKPAAKPAPNRGVKWGYDGLSTPLNFREHLHADKLELKGHENHDRVEFIAFSFRR